MDKDLLSGDPVKLSIIDGLVRKLVKKTQPSYRKRINDFLEFMEQIISNKEAEGTIFNPSEPILDDSIAPKKFDLTDEKLFTEDYKFYNFFLNGQLIENYRLFGLEGHYLLTSPSYSGKSKLIERLRTLQENILVIDCRDVYRNGNNNFIELLSIEFDKYQNLLLPTSNLIAFEKEIVKYIILLENWDYLTSTQREKILLNTHQIPNLIISTTNSFPKEFEQWDHQTIEILPFNHSTVNGILNRKTNNQLKRRIDFLSTLSFGYYYGGMDYIYSNFTRNIDEIVTGFLDTIAPVTNENDKQAVATLLETIKRLFKNKFEIISFSDLMYKENSIREKFIVDIDNFISDNKIPFNNTYYLYDSDSLDYFSKIIQIKDGFFSFQYIELLWLFIALAVTTDSPINDYNAAQYGYRVCKSSPMWDFFVSYFEGRINS